MTPNTLRALKIIRDNPGCRLEEFSLEHFNGQIRPALSGYLGKLENRGLITKSEEGRYHLTLTGREAVGTERQTTMFED